jgi:4-hydroxy-tetrahydrodipicolinate synthase
MHPLDGVIVPLVTALDDAARPDAAGSQRFLDALAEAGVRTLMLLGSNGEGALLPPDTTRGYLREMVELWRAAQPDGAVVVNVSAPGTAEMQRRAELALEADPDVVMTSPPGYFRHRPDEIEAHVRALAAFGHPFAIYNIPAYMNPLPPEVFEALLDEPQLVGIKDSSGDLELLTRFVELASVRDDVVVTQGDEARLVHGLRAGARGIVPGLANIVPATSVRLYSATMGGDDRAAKEAQAVLTSLIGIHAIRRGVPTVKGILHDRGLLPSARCAAPLAAVTPEELARLREFLAPFETDLVGER